MSDSIPPTPRWRDDGGLGSLPTLEWTSWRDTKDTLHLMCQIVGKVKLACSPPRNHWWNVALLPSARGLSTGPLRSGARTFALEFDFHAHELNLQVSDGSGSWVALRDGRSVSDFDTELHAALARFGLDVTLDERPFGTPVSDIAFPEDRVHASYDADAVRSFWRANDWTAGVLEEFSGSYVGKQSPVHLFWHSFDLALARYSGRRAPEMPGADAVTREAYSHEVVAVGFFAGDVTTQHAAFYSYTAPEPDGLTEQPLSPTEATWTTVANGGHLALLAYDDERAATDPRATLLSFLESAYQAGARAAGWDQAALRSSSAR